ncbi:PEP-CTERM sorting domain-containing protein [Phycisphaerales bacterium AB-hyl4]|uniref:PEP-CTERM sorting domain-containing protein n=1 Tax=Natronomicrosphaera hydrolytica TaxID=3242702 RepID=A0ABV4U189_9BACT
MSIAKRWRGSVVALAMTGATLGGATFSGQEAEAATYFQTAEPVETQMTGVTSRGRAVHITPNETFTVFSIDVWARLNDHITTHFEIFRHPEGAQSNTWPGELDAATYQTHAPTFDTENAGSSNPDQYDWISFAFNYTFEAGMGYVLYWHADGATLPSEALQETSQLDQGNDPLVTVDFGISGAPPVPGSWNFYTPVFRLAIPEPTVASLMVFGGMAALLRRRR